MPELEAPEKDVGCAPTFQTNCTESVINAAKLWYWSARQLLVHF